LLIFYSRTRGLAKRCLPVALAGLLAVTQTQAALGAAESPQAGSPQVAPAQAAPAQAAPPAEGQPAPQTPPPVPAQPLAQLPVEQSLNVRILAGSDEENDLERRIMAPLVVQVTDRNARPVVTADVVFRFPLSGPGAVFAGGKTSETVRTNSDGQASALNWMANGQVGKFQVHVTATYGNQVGEATLSMINVARVVEEKPKSQAASWWSHRWVKIAVIGGAAAAIGIGVFLATRGGSKGSSGGVTVAPGSPTVGAPQD
jgi:hypothetical protein